MSELHFVDIILLLSSGALVGLLAGLLGIGGGLIVVPILLYLLPQFGIHAELVTHMAIATSMATIVVTSIASVRAHNRHGTILWHVFWAMVPGIIIGGLLGSYATKYIPSENLKMIFGIFALLIATQMIFKFRPSFNLKEPGKFRLAISGAIISTISALVGIGGGSLTVPYLSFWNTKMAKAVGTSSAIGLPLSISGTVGFIIAGLQIPDRPAYSLGYVYLPAFLGIVLVSSFTAQLGARLVLKLSSKILTRIFASFLIIIGLDIIISNL
ncbi:MAG TPA: sulfite exporter TauE/SafE family protein [Aeromonadales bacterium]|nr:sulfite exporter TauE/SafE family protein [Aeromonadales bacterium]